MLKGVKRHQDIPATRVIPRTPTFTASLMSSLRRSHKCVNI